MNVLEKLRDDEEYYNGVGKQYLSASDIGTLLENPKHFGTRRGDHKNFLVGRYFHQLILEPEKAAEALIIDASTRNTKIYKDALEEHSVNIALLKSEADQMSRLATEMTSNMDFYDMIRADGNQYEVPAVKEMFGLQWKGKTDILGAEFLYDLKTTSAIDDFKWSARKYNYDSQAWIYEQLFGKPLVFLVIDKTSGMLGKFVPTPEWLDRGKEKVERAVGIWNQFFGPAKTDDINHYYINETL